MLVNLGIGWASEDDSWQVSLDARNVTDEQRRYAGLRPRVALRMQRSVLSSAALVWRVSLARAHSEGRQESGGFAMSAASSDCPRRGPAERPGRRSSTCTQTLSPGFPGARAAAAIRQCAPLKVEQVSKYDEAGPGWYWNNFSCNEHTGTHFDAPIHWITGRDLPNNSTDTLPVEHVVGQACVIDCSKQAHANPDYLLTVDDCRRGSARTGASPRSHGCSCGTDWSKTRDVSSLQEHERDLASTRRARRRKRSGF